MQDCCIKVGLESYDGVVRIEEIKIFVREVVENEESESLSLLNKTNRETSVRVAYIRREATLRYDGEDQSHVHCE